MVDDDEDLSDHGTDTYSQSLPSAHESEQEQFEPTPPAQPSVGHGGNENHARVYISCTGKIGLGCRWVGRGVGGGGRCRARVGIRFGVCWLCDEGGLGKRRGHVTHNLNEGVFIS